MSSGPELSLVCKSCGAEVSPYITECPYCGARSRSARPKLDRGGVPRPPKRARSRPQLPRLRPGEIPGIRADRRAWATWLIVLAPAARHGRAQVRAVQLRQLRATAPASTTRGARSRRCSPTRTRATSSPCVGAIALFGWLLERRHGGWAPLLVFLVTGAGGAYVDIAVAGEPRARRQRRGARPARRVVDARRARPPRAAARTRATCSACSPSPPCSSCCRSPPRTRAASPGSSAACSASSSGSASPRSENAEPPKVG